MHMCLRFTAKPVVSLGTEILFIVLHLSVQDFIGAAAERAATTATLHDGAGGTARAIQLPLWPDNPAHAANGVADVLANAINIAGGGSGNAAGTANAAAGGNNSK